MKSEGKSKINSRKNIHGNEAKSLIQNEMGCGMWDVQVTRGVGRPLPIFSQHFLALPLA